MDCGDLYGSDIVILSLLVALKMLFIYMILFNNNCRYRFDLIEKKSQD